MGQYRRKPAKVDAIKLTAAMSIKDDTGDVAIEGLPGNWLITHEDGTHTILDDEAFIVEYEDAKNMLPPGQWQEVTRFSTNTVDTATITGKPPEEFSVSIGAQSMDEVPPKPDPGTSSPSFDNFTERARKVLALGRQEAMKLNQEYIGTEHLLAGLVLEQGGIAFNVFKNLKIDPVRIIRAIESRQELGDAKDIVPGKLPFTPRTKRVIDFAKVGAQKMGHAHVGTEHLLIALTREKEGMAYEIMMEMGMAEDVIFSQIAALLDAD